MEDYTEFRVLFGVAGLVLLLFTGRFLFPAVAFVLAPFLALATRGASARGGFLRGVGDLPENARASSGRSPWRRCGD